MAFSRLTNWRTYPYNAGRIIPEWIDQNHGLWCPDSLRRQAIDIYVVCD